MKQKLGKIKGIKFGFGGYQDCQLGASFTLGGEGWGVGDFWGAWGMERTEGAEWTEESRIKHLGEVAMKIRDLLKAANVDDISKLEGIPIEVTFDGMKLKSWRILKEVI